MHQPDAVIANLLNECAGAYSNRTIQGYAADLRIFIGWCLEHDQAWLPAAPMAVAAFVDDQVEVYGVATIKRRICSIAFAHRMLDLPTPTDARDVKLAIRRAARQLARRQHQKLGLTHKVRSKIVRACPATMAGARDAALISVGYDTLCRSSELAAMSVEHIRFNEDGVPDFVLIPRSKSDIEGDGRAAHLSPETSRLLTKWLDAAKLTGGPMFRSLHLHRVADGPLATSSIRRIIKRGAKRAGLDPSTVADLSGHSMRIGAAQDMLVTGFDALAIMQAGGWKSANVVIRYVENASTRELHERRWRRLS